MSVHGIPRASMTSARVKYSFSIRDIDAALHQAHYYDRIVDVMEELVKFTHLTRDNSSYLVDRYSERKESAQALSKRVNQRSI